MIQTFFNLPNNDGKITMYKSSLYIIHTFISITITIYEIYSDVYMCTLQMHMEPAFNGRLALILDFECHITVDNLELKRDEVHHL